MSLSSITHLYFLRKVILNYLEKGKKLVRKKCGNDFRTFSVLSISISKNYNQLITSELLHQLPLHPSFRQTF